MIVPFFEVVFEKRRPLRKFGIVIVINMQMVILMFMMNWILVILMNTIKLELVGGRRTCSFGTVVFDFLDVIRMVFVDGWTDFGFSDEVERRMRVWVLGIAVPGIIEIGLGDWRVVFISSH